MPFLSHRRTRRRREPMQKLQRWQLKTLSKPRRKQGMRQKWRNRTRGTSQLHGRLGQVFLPLVHRRERIPPRESSTCHLFLRPLPPSVLRPSMYGTKTFQSSTPIQPACRLILVSSFPYSSFLPSLTSHVGKEKGKGREGEKAIKGMCLFIVRAFLFISCRC